MLEIIWIQTRRSRESLGLGKQGRPSMTEVNWQTEAARLQAEAARLQAENETLRRETGQLREDKQSLHRRVVDVDFRYRALQKEAEGFRQETARLHKEEQRLLELVEQLEQLRQVSEDGRANDLKAEISRLRSLCST